MEEKLFRKQLRREFSPLGWALLIYLLILNASVLLFMMIDGLILSLRQINGEVLSEDQITSILMNNGWGYLAAISIGLVALRVWKGKEFCHRTLWTRGKPMGFGDFLCLLCLFISGQTAFQLLATVLEMILNQFGLSAMDSIEAATMSADSLSMFLYAGIGAPIAEEILFRGLVLRQLEPYGKRFAIVLSALTFAVFHGNLVQIPYAFLVGLVLGYVAIEHNILWAMVLHMVNNLVLADILARLTSGLPEAVSGAILTTIIGVCTLAAAVILLVRRAEIGDYHRQNRGSGRYVGAFFTSPGVIALLIFVLYTVASPLASQIVENLAEAAVMILS